MHSIFPLENRSNHFETGVQKINGFKQVFLVYPDVKYDCPVQPDQSPYTFRRTDTLYAEVSNKYIFKLK